MPFKSAANSIAKKVGVPMKNAEAILAAGARKASPAARRANPNLNKVSGMPPMHHNGEKKGIWPHN
jgi:hypothetical protein